MLLRYFSKVRCTLVTRCTSIAVSLIELVLFFDYSAHLIKPNIIYQNNDSVIGDD